MLIQEVFYAVKCDRCGAICGDEEYCFHADKGDALEQMQDYDWEEINGKHYCEDCIVETEDGFTAKPPYPDSVKVVEKFVKTIMGAIPRTTEEEAEFKVEYFERRETMEYDIAWLTARLGDALISFERQDINGCRNKRVTICLEK